LIVVNGIPFETYIASDFDFATAREEEYADLLNVNPDDILEIVILKDAASTAIWGSKGANGVLQITTKKGARGKPQVQYSFRLTGAYMPDPIPLLNGDSYTMLMKEAYLNPTLDDEPGNIPEYNYQQYPLGDERNAFFWNYNNNTDWVSEITQTAWKQDHNLSLTGGGDRGTYRISFGYLDESGIVIGQGLKRFSNRVDLQYRLSDRLLFFSEFAYTYSDNDKNYHDLLDIAMRKMPNTPVYARDKFGNSTDVFFNIDRDASNLHESQRDMVNPVASARLAKNNEKSYRIIPTFRLQYDLLNPEEQLLRFQSVVSIDMADKKNITFAPKEITGAEYSNDQINRAYDYEAINKNMLFDNNIIWQPKLPEQHSFMAKLSIQTNLGSSTWQSSTAYWTPNFQIVSPEQGRIVDLKSNSNEWHSYGLVGTAHYAFLERYIADFTLRRDVSSRFGPAHRVGYFPGVSLKWILSDEPFMKWMKPAVSMLALRPSWGQSGNEPKSDFLFYSKYSSFSFNYMNMPAVYPNGLLIEDLRWETTTQTNLGADLSLFNNRLTLDFNYYHKRTEDLLFSNIGLPSTSGYSSISSENVGVMDNDGWELNAHASKVVQFGNFSVDLNFNFSHYTNTIRELSDRINPMKGDMLANGEYLRNIIIGNPLGSFYGYRYKGVYEYSNYIPGVQENAPVARDANGNVFYDQNGAPKPMYFAYNSSIRHRFQGGDAIYEDINHDGSIDELDVVYLGNANPKLQGGFGLLFRYKNFSINSFFHFRYGNQIVNEARMKQENMYSNDNQSIAVEWRWRQDGDHTNMPRALYNTGHNWLGSDRFVEDGSFLRFKYLTFNYSLPKDWVKKAYLSDVKVFCTINNLYIWTNYSGVDPEVGYAVSNDDPFKIGYDRSKTPRSKDVTFGLTANF
jgi:TonB-linked SusC/RagA family outer membrane protein